MNLSPGDITISDGYKATYVASWAAFTPAALLMFSFVGSSTKTIKILRIGVSGTQTTVSNILLLARIVSPNGTLSGGVSVAPTGIVPFDSSSPAATGAPLVYTTAYTLSAGAFRTLNSKYFKVQTAAPIYAEQNELIFDFTTDFGQAATLASVNDIFGLNFESSPSGLSITLWVEWTEE